MSIKISHSEFSLHDLSVLKTKWRLLEKRAMPTIFLSWQWIGHWLKIVKDPVFLVEAYQNGSLVGLGLFVSRKRKVFGLFSITQWLLHRTGEQKEDQIWIEHNDFLLDRAYEQETREALVKHVYSNSDLSGVKEVIVGLSQEPVIRTFSEYFKGSLELINSPGALVNLAEIKDDYVQECLSKNTRAQIKRSINLLSEAGSLTFRVEDDWMKIKELLPHIEKIHISRWENTAEGSGFTNELFTNFHQHLLSSVNGEAQVAVLSQNNQDVAYIINYLSGSHVSFYLSAISFSNNKKIKVGMVLHSMAIQHYFEQGLKSYDLLGGEAQYKKSLATHQYALSMNAFHKKSWLLAIECLLKQIKRKFSR